jgi:hypothetical protein
MTRRMAANVAVTQDTAGNLKPAKDKSTERIDGIVTLIMTIGRALVAQEELREAMIGLGHFCLVGRCLRSPAAGTARAGFRPTPSAEPIRNAALHGSAQLVRCRILFEGRARGKFRGHGT